MTEKELTLSRLNNWREFYVNGWRRYTAKAIQCQAAHDVAGQAFAERYAARQLELAGQVYTEYLDIKLGFGSTVES